MRTGQVAARGGVSPETVVRWAKTGLLPHTWTLGGRLRFRTSDVERLVPDATQWMRSGKVAELFRHDLSTVRRWAKSGRFTTVRDLSGHHMFLRAEIDAILRGETPGGEGRG